MAKQTRKNLHDRAGVVKVETTLGANTANRVGGIEQDIADTYLTDWDATSSYAVGEGAVWQGRIVTAFQPTTPGQSPQTHPGKWTDYVVDSLEKQLAGIANYPVLGSILTAYVTQRIAEVNAAQGGIPEASVAEINTATIHNKYVSPAGLGAALTSILQTINTLVGATDSNLLSLVQKAGTITVAHPTNDLPAILDLLLANAGASVGEKLCNLLTLAGCSGKTGSATLGLSTADMDALARFVYAYTAYYIEQRPGAILPDYPAFTGAPITNNNPVINSNTSRYDNNSLTLRASVSFAGSSAVNGRVVGVNGSVVSNGAWYPLELVEGDATSGTWQLNLSTTPGGGWLAGPAEYDTEIRIGTDESTKKALRISVASNPLLPTGEYRPVGNLNPAEDAVNEQYGLQERRTDGQWYPYTGVFACALQAAPGYTLPADISIDPATGLFTGSSNPISQDTPIVIAMVNGIETFLYPVTLKNVTGGSNPAPIINIVSHDELPNLGYRSLANATAPVEVLQQFYKLVSGNEVLYSQSGWKAIDLSAGAYSPSGTLVAYLWGYNRPTEAGTYVVRESWRPIGDTEADVSRYKHLAPYTITVGTSLVNTEWEIDPDFLATGILAMDYQFFINSGNQNGATGQYPQLFIYLKVNNANDALQMANEILGPQAFALPKSAYSGFTAGDYGNGYTLRTSLTGAIATTIQKLYFRKSGASTDLLVLTLPTLPNANVAKTPFYSAT